MESIAVEYFRNPRVDLGSGLIATLVLVISGALAGLMPAGKPPRSTRSWRCGIKGSEGAMLEWLYCYRASHSTSENNITLQQYNIETIQQYKNHMLDQDTWQEILGTIKSTSSEPG